MKEKIDFIMLIDDDEATNFIHKMMISQMKYTNKCEVFESSENALQFLIESQPSELPNLILLDLNMPGMNGWEFLIEFEKLNISDQIVIIVISSSTNPKDKLRVEKNNCVHGFEEKVLNPAKIERIIQCYYSENNLKL